MTNQQRQRMRYACRVFSIREEEKMWLEMCRNVPTISYLHVHELAMFYDIVMRIS